MKSILATAAIVLVAVGVVTATQGAKAGADAGVAQALIAKENQWAAASKASNGDAIALMLSEDFVALDSDGSMHSKAEVVARTKKSKWTTNEISDLKVMVHGDSAIVSGSWKGVGTDGAGKSVNATERWMDTWVKAANGQWHCVGSASAPAK